MKQTTTATKLKVGDCIGIVAPSSPVIERLENQFRAGLSFLENLGFKIVLGKHLYSTTYGYCAAPQEKAEDINDMFRNTAITGIICAQGGDTANACLPHLDYEAIKQNPKVFLGISDITTLLNAIWAKTGLITFHGNDIMYGFGRSPSAFDRNEFVAMLMNRRLGPMPLNGKHTVIRQGSCKGILLGGNLRCLLKLAGTPYWPDFSNSVLFLEAYQITAEGCDHFFQQLKQIGVFSQIKGVIIGHIDSLEKNQSVMQMEDVLLQTTSEFDFPILKLSDFGHNCPNTVMPIGAEAEFDTTNCQISILNRIVV